MNAVRISRSRFFPFAIWCLGDFEPKSLVYPLRHVSQFNSCKEHDLTFVGFAFAILAEKHAPGLSLLVCCFNVARVFLH